MNARYHYDVTIKTELKMEKKMIRINELDLSYDIMNVGTVARWEHLRCRCVACGTVFGMEDKFGRLIHRAICGHRRRWTAFIRGKEKK